MFKAKRIRSQYNCTKEFLRYNDGIIQASILRCANHLELAYDLERQDSDEIKVIIENLIEHYQERNSEGLIEFLYAIAILKLRMKQVHLAEVTKLIDEKITNDVILGFNDFIKLNHFDSKKRAELYNNLIGHYFNCVKLLLSEQRFITLAVLKSFLDKTNISIGKRPFI